jgi:hypothetical protein
MSDMSYPTKENTKFMIVQGGEKKVMKKILSVALSTAMAFSMFASVAFGETATSPEAKFTALAAKGILNGYPDGQAHLEKDLTRAEFAKIVAKLLDLKEITTTLSFKDKNYTASHWARGYIEAVNAAGLMTGKTATTFDPSGKVTVQEVAAVLVRALKLEVPTTATNAASPWAQGFVQAAINSKLVDANANFKGNATRSLVVSAAYAVDVLKSAPVVTSAEALSPTSVLVTFADKTQATVTLTTALVEGVETPITFEHNGFTFKTKVTLVALKVASVSAVNGKDLEVVFNRAVDKITAETAANYEISINNASALATSAYTVHVDKDDAKKVHVTLSDASKLNNGAYVSVTVKKAILDAQLKALAADEVKTLTFVDNSAAAIQKVEIDNNNLKVTFNDYVSSVGLVKVNGVAKTAVVASPYSKTVVITDGAKDLANGTYTVQFANVQDIAGTTTNNTPFANGTFTVSTDTVSPVVSKIEKVDADTFKLTFNKNVTAPTVTVKKSGFDLTPTVNATADANVWTVDVANNGGVVLYATGESSAALTVTISGFKALSNNVVGDVATQTVTLTKDTTAPVVQTRFNEIVDADTTVGVNEVFNIRFDEVITVADSSKIILTDKDGIRKAVSSATVVADASGANTILQVQSTAVQTSGAVGNGTYTLSLGAGTVKDTSNNDNAAVTVSLAKSASTATDLAVTATAVGNVITIPFATDMTSSALDLANYKIDNQSLPTGTIAYFSGDKQTVKIELPAGSIANSESAVLSVSTSVVSVAGAKLNTASRNQVISGLVDNVVPTLVSAKKLTTTTIEVTFSEKLAATSDTVAFRNDFVVKVNGVTFAVANVTDGTAGDNKVVLTVDAYNVDQTVTVTMADSGIDVSDVAGNKATVKTSVTATK